MFNHNNSNISNIKDLNLNNGISKFNDYSLSNIRNSDNDVFYFLNTNQQYINNNSFSIYQGSNYNMNKNFNFNLFLPSVNYLEKNSSYVNFLGYYQKTKFILYPPKNSRSD